MTQYLLPLGDCAFTFQASTLERMVSEGKWWKAMVNVCDSESEVEQQRRDA